LANSSLAHQTKVMTARIYKEGRIMLVPWDDFTDFVAHRHRRISS
jgi:hypothetical protein